MLNRKPLHNISHKKTKNMFGQEKIDIVEDFTYMGSSMNNQGEMTKEISCRIGKASAAFT